MDEQQDLDFQNLDPSVKDILGKFMDMVTKAVTKGKASSITLNRSLDTTYSIEILVRPSKTKKEITIVS